MTKECNFLGASDNLKICLKIIVASGWGGHSNILSTNPYGVVFHFQNVDKRINMAQTRGI